MFPKRSIQSMLIYEDLQNRMKYLKDKKKRHRPLKGKVKTYFKLFLETSSIHGLNHLVATRRQYLEIILWLTIILLSVTGASYLSGLTWSRYQSSPTVVSLDKDMLAWNTTFPSVTVCPDRVLNIDRAKLEMYLRNSNVENITRLEQFIIALVNATYRNFEQVPDYPEVRPDKYMELIVNLSTPFKPTLTISQESSVVFTIVPTITEMGLCYAVNSITGIYNSLEYRAANRWDIITDSAKTLFIHPLDGEVFAKLTFDVATSFDVYIHGPQEIPDITSRSKLLTQGYYMKSYVTALTVYTSMEAAKLSVNQRRCRFPHENNLKHNTIYTYTMCRMECRIRLCLHYCHCIPHFYRRIGSPDCVSTTTCTYRGEAHRATVLQGFASCWAEEYGTDQYSVPSASFDSKRDEEVCNVEGLHCLAKYKDVLYTLQDKDGKRIDCACFPLCDDVNYILQPIALQKWILGTNLQWGMVTYPRVRYRRDIIFGFTDVLVAVGGMAGLFLGCSVLSFMEIVYFLTIRLLCYSYGYRSV